MSADCECIPGLYQSSSKPSKEFRDNRACHTDMVEHSRTGMEVRTQESMLSSDERQPQVVRRTVINACARQSVDCRSSAGGVATPNTSEFGIKKSMDARDGSPRRAPTRPTGYEQNVQRAKYCYQCGKARLVSKTDCKPADFCFWCGAHLVITVCDSCGHTMDCSYVDGRRNLCIDCVQQT